MESRRSAMVAAWVFALTLALYVLVFDRNFDTPEQIADWLDGNLAVQYAGSVAIAIAGVAFLWFMGRVSVLVSEVEAKGGSLSAIVFGASVIFVALLWVATPIDIGVAEYVGSEIDITTYEAISNIAHQHLLYSQIAVALALVTLWVVGRRAEVWPAWVNRLTLVVAATSVAQLVFPALVLLLPVWAVGFAIGTSRMQPTG